MRYVVAYDIEDDRIRTRISDLLSGYGERVQKSVFECELDGATFEELTERLRAGLEKPKAGQIRVYRLCADCFSVSFGLGEIERALTEPAIIIA